MAPIKDVITKAANTVWEVLGPGHSESVYHAALRHELENAIEVIQLSSGRCVPIFYKGVCVGRAELDLDFVTENATMCILELKAIKALREDDRVQLQRYRRLFANVTTIGFLLNFGGASPEVEQVGDLTLPGQ